jgi:hypothetical protein
MRRVQAYVVIMWVGSAGCVVALAVATGEVPVTAVAVSLQGWPGWPGRRVAAGVGLVAFGAPMGVAAAAMAASTRGRHKRR